MAEETQKPPIVRPRFGFGTPGGPDPSAAGLKGGAGKRRNYSIRNTMRDLVDEGIKVDSIEDLEKAMIAKLKEGKLREALAIRGIMHAFKDSHDSFDRVVDNVEGRLATVANNHNLNANMNLDEGDDDDAVDLAAIRKSLLRRLDSPSTDGGTPADGTGNQPEDPPQASS